MLKCERACLVPPLLATQGIKCIGCWIIWQSRKKRCNIDQNNESFSDTALKFASWQYLYYRDVERSRNGNCKNPTSAVSREAKFIRSCSQVSPSESRAVPGSSATTSVAQSHFPRILHSPSQLIFWGFFPSFWPAVLLRSRCAF